MASVVIGCGSLDNVSDVQLADPTNQLPAHQLWNSYNLYRFEPAPVNQWTLLVRQGQVLGALPVLGQRPILISHGLGGSIRTNTFNALAQNLVDNQNASAILGFEYDSQDSVARNGGFYTQALQQLNPGVDRLTWGLINHSMGGLVARSAVQAGTLPMAAQGNRFISVGTPHFGSPVANAVQNTGNLEARAAFVGVLNQGGFVNVDGNPSEVNLGAQGITDLRTDSIFLGALNGNINNHPQVNYYTVVGTSTGQYQTLNDLLGVSTADGFVTQTSANPPQLGALSSGFVPTDHTQMIADPNTFTLIRQMLTQ
jgi:triacylglycerol esterase/lipase EstA (alpha/beta hydrolase family)